MVKRKEAKEQIMIYKTLHRNQKIEPYCTHPTTV